jgi:hypothetical protein
MSPYTPTTCELCKCRLDPKATSKRCEYHQPDAIAARQQKRTELAAQFADIRKKHGV